MTIREDFLTVVESVVRLLAHPAVASRGGEPSALEDFAVGGLAVHLANQIHHIPQPPPSDGPPISLAENFARASWVGTDASAEVNVGIRRRAEELAAPGPAQMLADVEQTLAEVRTLIGNAPDDLVVHMVWSGWDLTFDEFLVTRLMELVVHSDDLAVSIDVDPPAIPESAALTVVNLLASLAVRRHGAIAVLRALSRAERSPATISAL